MNQSQENECFRMFAIDLDGTLLTDDKQITEGNKNAVADAMKAGVVMCVSTGRAWPGAKKFVRELGVTAPVITSNGAMIVDPLTEEVLYDLKLDFEDVRQIYRLGCEIGVTQIVWSGRQLYGSRMDEYLGDYSRRFGFMEPIVLQSIEDLCEKGVSKILWYFPEPTADGYLRKVPAALRDKLNIVTSTPFFLEFFHKEVSKAAAVEMVAERFNIPRSEIVCVGDAGNDLPMIRMAGLGVAMGNATDDVKAEADYITDDNMHDGVAKVIRRFLKE